jgi:hypothetical protein
MQSLSAGGRLCNTEFVKREDYAVRNVGSQRWWGPVGSKFVARTQAAGLRQRREVPADNLTRRRAGVPVRSRVLPGTAELTLRRKLLHRLRHAISH